MPAASRFLDLLRVLADYEVEFIVVGGVAAILEGAPISTFDLDVVHRRSPANIERLLEALQSLNARYQDPAGRHIEPDESKLSSPGQQQLLTDLGPLDVLGSIGSDRGFDELSTHCVTYELDDLRLKVLNLATVIQSKEEAGRDKDRAALPVLYRTLALQEKD